MDTDMEEDPQSLEHEAMNVNIEPRITNRAHGGVRTDKTRFIRPVERQRMRPWLIDHLDQNDIPGLAWQERTEMIFRISWKHAANQCFNMQKDTNLFERWAIHTGRHQDSDHKRWKANFRCALNSLPDVTELKEQGVKKGNNAFKVYRFLDEKEAKLSKDGKPRKKKEPPEYRDDSPYVKFKEGIVMSYDSAEGTSSEGDRASGSSLPNLHQLVPSGVDLLLEADNQEKLQPMSGIDNLQEILAAATASLAAGGDAVALEKISIEQLSRLGEVSKMKLDIRQSDRKRRKKEVSGILNVFLCNWCEKVFPTKVDLFQHFLIIHQDKLLSGEEYGARKHTKPTEKLQQEIEDLEKKVLGFTQESYQNESEEVIEDGQVVDLSSNNSMTSQEVYIEDQVLDLSVAGALAKHPQPQPDVALDLSLSTSKQKTGQKNATSKMVQKRRRSNASDGDYTNKFGNYGLAGAPRTKRQLSLLLKRKEEEEEKARKHAEAQHSMEDLVHAEILISLKSGSKEENETESMELENGIEKVECEEKAVIKTDKIENSVKKIGEQDAEKAEIMKEDDIDDKTEVVEEEEVASVDNVVYLELNDGSKVAVYKQVEIPPVEPEKTDHEEIKSRNSIPVVVDTLVEAENVNVIHSELDGNSGKPYKCALCPQRFEDPTELLTHVSVHKTEYKCSVCTKVMTDKDVYLSHIESHLPKGKHGQICEVCNVHFSTVEELQKHVKSHESGTKLYKCGNCGKTYQTVKECVNCEVCLLTNGKEKQAERRDTNVDIKDEIKDPGKTGGVDKTVNEKGAAGASEAAVKISDTEKDSLKEKIVNTGQKNLKGEPAITPVAGSDHLTGIVNSSVTGKKNADDKSPRKCSTQESFELPVNCLDDDADDVTQKNVRNDVVDGENSGSIQENKKTSNKVFAKKKSVLDLMDKQHLLSEYMEEKHKKASRNNVDYTVIKNEAFTNEEEVAKSNCDESFKTDNKLPKTIFQKEEKYSDYQKSFDSEEDGIKYKQSYKQSYKGPIEGKSKQLVFHCGMCNLKLHINDVESHLKTHRPSVPCKSSKEDTLEEKRSCVICKENIPVKSFYTHWKAHSVYDLSQAQNLKLAQRTETGRDGAGKCKMPFVCNLCSVKFTTFADLKLHVETHLGPRIFNGSKIDIQKEKSYVLETSKKAVAVNKDRGKKRKESDEKRITGKRPKGKRFKVNSKALKVKGGPVTAKKTKEDPKDIKEKTSPTIIAALQSKPKFSLKTETQDKESKHCVEQPSQSKQSGDSSVAQVVQLDKGSLLVLKNGAVISKEDKEESNALKRKKTDSVQLEATSPKKLKSTNENTLELTDSNENKLVDEGTKESNCNRFGACSQNIRHMQVIKSEPMDSVSDNSSETVSTVIDDKSNLGTNAKPSTLHRLQQKILLFKEGGVKVARPVLSSVPATVLTSLQALLSSSRPVTCQAISEARAQAIQVNKSSVGCALTGEAQTTEKSKSQTIPFVSVHGKNHSAKQESGADVQSLDVSTFSVSQPSSETKSVNSSVVLSASPQTYIVSMSSASSVNAVSQSPVAVQQSPMAYLPVSALAKGILQVHSSGGKANAAVSMATLTSTTQSVSLVGSLQNPTRYTAGMPLMSCSSKQTVTNVTSIKTVPSNITTSLNVLHQPQNQHNIMKSVIGRVSQPSVGNKSVMSPVLITQGGLQQAVPSTVKFPFSNIIYAPQTSSGSQTNDTVQAVDSTKPSYQLLLLPLSQPVSQNLMKTSPTVTQAVSKPQSFNNLSLENTVLGAKLRASNKVLNPLKADLSDCTIPSCKAFTTQPITPTVAVVSFSGKDFPKKKVSIVSQASSNCTLPTSSNSSLPTSTNSPLSRSDDIRVASSKPAIQFIAGMSDNVLCITCVVCKQTLNNVEEMSTHVCKISFVSPSVITATSSSEEKTSGSLLDSAGNETNLGPKVIRRISPCQGTTLTTHSPQIPLALSTLPSSARSAKVISSVTMTSSSTLFTRQLEGTSLVRDLPKQHAVEGSSSNIICLSEASPTQGKETSKISQESQDSTQLPTKSRVRDFVLKRKSNSGRNSPGIEEEIIEPEAAGDFEETMQSEDSSDVLMDYKDQVIAAGGSPKLVLQGASSSEQTLKGKTNSGVEHVITLYPCVICNKTFTLENFRKHAKKHMVEADITEEKGILEDKVPALIGEENCTREDSLSKKDSKPTEGSRKSDVYRCYFCFITYDDEKTLSQHYTKSHPSMTDYLCPADNCAQIFFEVQECDMHYAFKHQHECRFCLQRFRTYVEFQAHTVQHYKNKTLRYFSCVKCRTHFNNKKAFYRHLRTMPNKCPDTYLEKHVNCQQCQCCTINFTSKECLKLHFKRKFYHGVTFRCCICREVISNEKEVLNHMSSHFPTFDDKQVRFCHTCCIIFPYKSVLSHHLSSADHIRAETLHQRLLDKYGQILKGDEIPDVPAFSFGKSKNMDNRKEINSKNCENRSDSELAEKSESLNDGDVYKGKHSQSQFTCKLCNVCFKTLFSLKQHRVINHMRVPPGRNRCVFSGRTDIKKYRRSRYKKSIVCEFCSKRFHHISDLGKHINISHDVKAYLACKNPDCELSFNSFFEYEAHVCKTLPKGKDVGDISRTMVDAGQPSLKSMKEYMLQYYVEDCKQLLEKLTGTVESIQEHLGDHFACQYCEKRLHSCEQLKCHLIHQHNDKLAQCVDCLEYFFHQSTLTEHRRECAVKGFSDEDFHTKKKLLGCDVCFNSFLYILGLAKYLRDLKFLSDKYKSSETTCFSRKGVFDLKFEGECGIEEQSMVPFYNSRKFVCISCKNEYCNAEDFYICMKSRLTTEKNKLNEDTSKTISNDDTARNTDENLPLFGKAKIDLKNAFFCNECESIVCYQDGGICLASLKHPCSGSNTLI